MGYTKAQAAKYGHKGERVTALKEVINLLQSCDGNELLGYYHHFLDQLVKQLNSKELEIVNIAAPSGSDGTLQDLQHLSVSNKKIGYTCSVTYALQTYKLALEKYGHRALLAEKNEGIDWKATMHAVRIAAEAKELLLTSNITFPRPEKDLLLSIRKGELPYNQVEELIEQGLVDIKQAEAISTLPEKPNFSLMEEFVYGAHWNAIERL